MRIHFNFWLVLACISATGLVSNACFDIDDYVKRTHEKEPEPEKPYVPEKVPEDITDPVDEPKKPDGSSGVISGEDQDAGSETTGGETGGGEVVIPEELTLTSVTPSTGDIAGGYEVRIYGTKLSNEGSANFGMIASPKLMPVNEKVVRAVVPAGKKGCVDLSWSQDGEKVVLPDAFCYVQNVAFEGIEPQVAVAGTAVDVVIHGSGFDENTRVFFMDGENSLPLVDPHVESENVVTGLLPVLKSGKISVSIVNDAGHASASDVLTLIPDFEVSCVTPDVIEEGSSQTVVVSGNGFDNNTKVRIGSSQVVVSKMTEKEIQFRSPMLSAGHYDLFIWDDYRQLRRDKAVHYYKPDGSVQLLSVDPAVGSEKGGTLVSVRGVNLPAAGDLKFDTKTAAVQSRTANEWKVKTPAHGIGVVDIALGTAALPKAFEYIAAASALSLKSVEPAHAVVRDDTTVILKGTGFDKNMSVFFGPWAAENVTVRSADEAEVVVPPGAGNVSVTVQNGPHSASSSFTYDEAVSILGINPAESVLTGKTTIHLYGTGFDKNMSVQIAGEKIEASFVDAGHLTFQAPAHEVGQDTVRLLCSDKPCAETTMQWFNPTGINTSAAGGRLNGSLHVTVLTVDTAVPIENATVYVGSDLDTALKGKTDENGRVSFFDDSLDEAQIVIACAPEHSCNTIQPVNASYVTLLLEDWHADDPPSEQEDIEPPPPPPPSEGEINPIEITVPYAPKQPYFEGTVGGFGKVDLETSPNLVRAGLVMQSTLSPYMMSYDPEDIYLIKEEGGEYRLKAARKGDVALALVCGLFDESTNAFIPKYIGVKRHLFVTDGAIIKNHLECPLPLNQTQSIKLLDAPLHSGPNVVSAEAYIFVGDEGYLGGFMRGVSETDYVVITKMPPLRDELAESSFEITAGAYTNMNYPASVFNEYNVKPTPETIEVGPAAPIPVFLNTTNNDIMKEGVLSWKVEYPENVDFYALTIRGYNPRGTRLIWQFYLPGNATSAEFPPVYEWPTEYQETLYIQLTAYKSVRENFDFDKFSTGDTRYNYIHSSATSSMAIYNPNPVVPSY